MNLLVSLYRQTIFPVCPSQVWVSCHTCMFAGRLSPVNRSVALLVRVSWHHYCCALLINWVLEPGCWPCRTQPVACTCFDFSVGSEFLRKPTTILSNPQTPFQPSFLFSFISCLLLFLKEFVDKQTPLLWWFWLSINKFFVPQIGLIIELCNQLMPR